MLNKFWNWYEKNILLNQAIVIVLFLWQVLHLYWLTTHVVAYKIIGYAIINPSYFYQYLLIAADYFEMPALISGTIFYLYKFKKEHSKSNIFFIFLINSQWLHLFWITDEFVLNNLHSTKTVLPMWLAWIAIFIDYLELPVIYDTIKKTISSKVIGSA